MKVHSLRFLSIFLSIAVLVGAGFTHTVFASEQPKKEVLTANSSLTSKLGASETSAVNTSSSDPFFPYNVYFDFVADKVDIMAFNAHVGHDRNIEFTDFFVGAGAVKDNYTMKVYTANGDLIFDYTIKKGQFIEYWGKVLFDKLNEVTIPVGSYFEITGMENSEVRINGHTINQQKDYIFEHHGVVETNNGASVFPYKTPITLGAESGNFKFSAKATNDFTTRPIDNTIVFEKISSAQSSFEDNYTITIYDFTGSVRYKKDIVQGQPLSVGDDLIKELNQLKVEWGDAITITGMQHSHAEIGAAYTDPSEKYRFYARDMRKDVVDVRSYPYPGTFYFRTTFLVDKISFHLGNDGYMEFKKDGVWESDDIFIDNFNIGIYSVDGTLKYSADIKAGQSIPVEGQKLIEGLNNAKIKHGDYMKLTGMRSEDSIMLNYMPVKSGQEFTFTYKGLIAHDFVQQYSTKIMLGVTGSVSDHRVSFNANVNEKGEISFSGPLYYNKFYSTFDDTFQIKVFDKQGKLKFSQYINKGQDIGYWGRLMIEDLNKANIKLGDYFTITRMKTSGVTINGKPLDPLKQYVFGNVGVFPK